MSTLQERGHEIIEVDSGFGYKIRVCKHCNILEEEIIINKLNCIPKSRRRERQMVNTYSCKGEGCGVELTALNMSEDEDYCKKCFDKIVEGIDINDESPETKFLKERELDEIIASPCPQEYTALPHVQRYR